MSKFGYREYNGCPVTCSKCQQHTFSFTVLWANAYGTKIRVFCGACKWATDYKNLYTNDAPAVMTYECSMPHLED
jgi:hypothetical protein